MSTDTQLAVIEHTGELAELSVDDVLARLNKVQELMRRAMEVGTDFGVIPGTSSKPTLLKPGAEKLCLLFQLSPEYNTIKTFHDDGHLTVESTCRILSHGIFRGEASAMCSTREVKYAYRKGERVCPRCGKPAIIKGKAEFGGGWICWAKKDGCNAKFADTDAAITSQSVARVANADIADSFNTVLRLAEKRAFIAAVRLVTGSSSLFDEEIPGQTERHEEDENQDRGTESSQAAETPNGLAWLAEYEAAVANSVDEQSLALAEFNARGPFGKLTGAQKEALKGRLLAVKAAKDAKRSGWAKSPDQSSVKQKIADDLIKEFGMPNFQKAIDDLGVRGSLEDWSLEQLNAIGQKLKSTPF